MHAYQVVLPHQPRTTHLRFTGTSSEGSSSTRGSQASSAVIRRYPQRPVPFLVVPAGMSQQRVIALLAVFAGLPSFPPFIVAGTVQHQHRAHPLHSMVVSVLFNELEADHQFVSASKYFVALRKMPAPRPARCWRTPEPCSAPAAPDSLLGPGPDAVLRSIRRQGFERCQQDCWVGIPRLIRSCRTQIFDVSHAMPRSCATLAFPRSGWDS